MRQCYRIGGLFMLIVGPQLILSELQPEIGWYFAGRFGSRSGYTPKSDTERNLL